MTPLCACHGEPMYPNSTSHGGWGCRVKKRERDRRYLLTTKGRARTRRFRLREAVSRREAFIQRVKETT